MDYREELINKTMLMLNDAGFDDLVTIRSIFAAAMSDYEVTSRCTELAVLDAGNTQAIKMFLATKRVEGGSLQTLKNRGYVLNRFSNDLGMPFEDMTQFDILGWLASLHGRIKASTIDNYRSIIHSFFSWMAKNGAIEASPMENIKRIKHPEPVQSPFSQVEVDALKGACRTRMERAAVELMLSSGIRNNELCNLKWSDINFTTKDIKVIEGKGSKNRVTMMDDVTRKYLLEYKASMKYTSEYVFATKYKDRVQARSTDSIWLMLKKLSQRANVSDVHPHRFRHTFATTMYKRGLDVRMIQQLLGHSSVNVTMVYINTDLETLRDAYKKCV